MMNGAEWSAPPESVAVIGMSARFPSARNVEEFWEVLKDGVETIRVFTPEELAAAGVDAFTLAQPNYVPAHGYLEDADLFDASFFGYSPADARLLDPQFRCFLECAWEALEHAGYDPESYPGLMGVFGGCSTSSYVFQIYSAGEAFDPTQIALSTDKDHLATQVSYKLNLKGPSATVQCACSTSLVAVALAAQSLLDSHCDIALAGGVSISTALKKGYIYQDGGILSPDGHCRPYDADASGTVAGSGAGIVVLKRLSEAISDGDTIHAVIRGWALNNDGSSKVSYAAPSVDGQAKAVALTQAVAGVHPDSIGLIEGHGTATNLGDPVEVAALTQAFRAYTARRSYCALGSVKSNMGHLDAAAGIAGLIKAILAVERGVIPPSLHFQKANPQLELETTPFYVPAQAVDWPAELRPRRAGISSFGIGGTNAHIVIEEAPATQGAGVSRQWQLLPLSARTTAALEQSASNLREHLRLDPELALGDVAYTLQAGRQSFAKRRFVVCESAQEACKLLESPATHALSGSHELPAAFLFPGQGSQYVDMLAGVYREEPVIREHVDMCAEILRPMLGLDLRKIIYPHGDGGERAAEQLTQTSIAQPALFVIEYALAQLWMHFGVQPAAAIGHSIGEYVAACLAQVFSLEDALWLVSERGRLMQTAPRGAMLSVAAREQDLTASLGPQLSLAAVNGPASCVLSGDFEAVDLLAAELARREIPCRKLHTSHAFHSALMDSIIEPFARTVEMVPLRAPRMAWLSNLTGDWISDTEATDPGYWTLHLRHTVRFHDGLARLLNEAEVALLEVGPGTTLTSLARQIRISGKTPPVVATSRHPEQNEPDGKVLANAVGQLWASGVSIDWNAYHSHERRRRVPLPTYPFQRERYWIEAKAAAADFWPTFVSKLPIEHWFHVPCWRSATPGALLHSTEAEPKSRSWVLMGQESALVGAVAEQLHAEGQQVIVANAFTDEIPLPDVVLHFGNCTANECDSAATKEAAFYSLLELAKALGTRETERTIDIGVIANGLHALPGDSHAIDPMKALALGPCTVIPQEYPQLRCRSVDVMLEPGAEAHVAREIIDEFTSELFAPAAAWRGTLRWVRDFESVALEAPATTRLRERGVYLITGGLGGIGLVLAQFLAKQARAKLVLLGRTELPPRDTWAEWLASHGADEKTCVRIRTVEQLEADGAEVLVLKADVADWHSMRSALGTITERFGTLHGVVHSAGVAGGGIIELKTREIAEQVFAPKVEGTSILYSLLAGQKLDFFAICSSMSSLVGGAGQVDYCAANNFLDAFAIRHGADLPLVSINWDAWQEVGMAVNTDVPESMRALRALTLANAITPAEGADAFARVLSTKLRQVAVCTIDFDAALHPDLTKADAGADAVPEPVATETHARPELSVAFEAPRDDRERMVASIWEALLGIEQVGRDDSFFELGGHSLLAIQFLSRIRETTGVQLAVADLFELKTVARVAARLDTIGGAGAAGEDWRLLLDEVEALSDAEVSARNAGRARAGAG